MRNKLVFNVRKYLDNLYHYRLLVMKVICVIIVIVVSIITD